MRLYNTLSRTLDEVLTPDVSDGSRPFGMYVCGPTVYDVPHFGHARAALVPDLLRRVLQHKGVRVLHVRNVTDVDDKIIARAEQDGVHPAQTSETYTRIYDDEMARLGVLPPHIAPRATGHIVEMIELARQLIELGYAYVVPGTAEAVEGSQDVMFRVRSFTEYGRLSGRNLDDMRAGARVEQDTRKEDPGDFVLWKAAKPGEPSWASPWGRGRPGWHSECVAMANKYLSGGFDLHAGGQDLIFPHHENEIAQAEALSGGERFARLWMHNGLLNIDGEKMSKSLGNLITLQEALDTYGGPVLRLYYLQHHYRSTAQFSAERLEDVRAAWKRLTAFVDTAPEGGDLDEDAMAEAMGHLEDDLNSPAAVSVAFNAVRDGHAALVDGDGARAGEARATVIAILAVMGLELGGRADDDGVDLDLLVQTLLRLRAEARERGHYDTADEIRELLGKAGITVEDGRDGARWRLA